MAGHIVDFSRNVPKRDVDARYGCSSNNIVSMPEMLPVHHLPQVLYPGWIFTNQELGNIFNRANNRTRVPFQSCLSPAPKTGLVSQNFNKNPVTHFCMANQRL